MGSSLCEEASEFAGVIKSILGVAAGIAEQVARLIAHEVPQLNDQTDTCSARLQHYPMRILGCRTGTSTATTVAQQLETAASSSSTAELLVGPMERDLVGINWPVALHAKVRDAA